MARSFGPSRSQLQDFLPPPCLRFQLTTLDKKHIWKIERPLLSRDLISGEASTESEHFWQLVQSSDRDGSRVKLQHRDSGYVIEEPKSNPTSRPIQAKQESGQRSDRQWLSIETREDGSDEFKLRFAQTSALLCYKLLKDGIYTRVVIPEKDQDEGSAQRPFIDRFGIKIEEISLVDIEYQLDKGTTTPPQNITCIGELATNDTGVPQTTTLQISETRESSSNWRNDFALKFQVESTTKVGIPQYCDTSIRLTREQTRNITWGTVETESLTWHKTINLSMEPFSSYEVKSSITRRNLQVPFVAIWRVVRSQQTFSTKGVYQGVSWVDFKTVWTDVTGKADLLADPLSKTPDKS
jgi:hypothetical protein